MRYFHFEYYFLKECVNFLYYFFIIKTPTTPVGICKHNHAFS